MHNIKAGILALSLLTSFSCSKKLTESDSFPVETGVSQNLAEYRAQVLTDIAYAIRFDIPTHKEEPIPASEIIYFNLKRLDHPLQLDFKEETNHLKSIEVNGKKLPLIHSSEPPVHRKEHIVIPLRFLKKGKNEVRIRFIAGNLSLNRNEDYLYTLLVPDRARTVFPCFDQPDLKATFKLSLTLPQEWKALANAPLQDSLIAENRKTYTYQNSDQISTYLFSFAAGKFDKISQHEGGRTMHFYHRETDASKLKLSIAPTFRIHRDALAFMEEYTGTSYPFQKFDFVAIPDFQYGGMEHVGAIQYKASALFLDEGATRDKEVSRSNLIAHETAHMWFGDLVTMRWFNDVWTKEVFANFMADKITKVSLKDSNYNLKFLIDHFPAAYGVDRTAGANPIRQNLDNLQDAGSLYGNIIYHKAPIMMRQLERLMGEKAFQEGLRQYLKKYAFENAAWPDLISILDAQTPADLQAWNQVWVNEPGRPVFDYQLQTGGNKITSFTLSQEGEDGSDRLWPQLFEVAFVYKDRMEEFTVNMNRKTVSVTEAEGKATPLYILFNSSGQGYGLFPVDQKQVPVTSDNKNLAAIAGFKDPVMRAAAYINLYENLLSNRLGDPNLFLVFTATEAARETEELNIKLLTGQFNDVYWRLITPERRITLAPLYENRFWEAMQKQTHPNSKKLLFKTYQSIALTKQAQERLYRIWQQEKAPEGVKLTEDDYTSLALSLAMRDYPGNILGEQLKRIKNTDRQKRLQFLIPALSGDAATRDAFFASLKKRENREKEAWVATALGYLHHPLHAATSEKYLRESLELIEEIQLTGDIFFPTNWLHATFSTYQSPEAAAVVRRFLAEHPTYNPKLKGKILQAADGIFRAEKLLYSGN